MTHQTLSIYLVPQQLVEVALNTIWQECPEGRKIGEGGGVSIIFAKFFETFKNIEVC